MATQICIIQFHQRMWWVLKEIQLPLPPQLAKHDITAGFGRVLGIPVTVRFIWWGVTVGLGRFP